MSAEEGGGATITGSPEIRRKRSKYAKYRPCGLWRYPPFFAAVRHPALFAVARRLASLSVVRRRVSGIPPPLRKHQPGQESDGQTGSWCLDKAVQPRDAQYQKKACPENLPIPHPKHNSRNWALEHNV